MFGSRVLKCSISARHNRSPSTYLIELNLLRFLPLLRHAGELLNPAFKLCFQILQFSSFPLSWSALNGFMLCFEHAFAVFAKYRTSYVTVPDPSMDVICISATAAAPYRILLKMKNSLQHYFGVFDFLNVDGCLVKANLVDHVNFLDASR